MSKDNEDQLNKCVLSVAGSGCAKVSATASCHIRSYFEDILQLSWRCGTWKKRCCNFSQSLKQSLSPSTMIITTMQFLNFRQ